jgi:hypothetical protein
VVQRDPSLTGRITVKSVSGTSISAPGQKRRAFNERDGLRSGWINLNYHATAYRATVHQPVGFDQLIERKHFSDLR